MVRIHALVAAQALPPQRGLALAEGVFADGESDADLGAVGAAAGLLAIWCSGREPMSPRLRQLMRALCDRVREGDYALRYAAGYAALALHREHSSDPLACWSPCGFGFGVTPVEPVASGVRDWERWKASWEF